MKARWAIVPLSITMALLAAEAMVLRHDHLRNACYDVGRVRGGMEQRAYDAKMNGDEILKSDADGLNKPAPDECR